MSAERYWCQIIVLQSNTSCFNCGFRHCHCMGSCQHACSMTFPGEFYFSDVYSDRRLPPAAASHPVLVGEIGGALYINDFLRLCHDVGFSAPRALTIRSFAVSYSPSSVMPCPWRCFDSHISLPTSNQPLWLDVRALNLAQHRWTTRRCAS